MLVPILSSTLSSALREMRAQQESRTREVFQRMAEDVQMAVAQNSGTGDGFTAGIRRIVHRLKGNCEGCGAPHSSSTTCLYCRRAR